MGGGWEDLASAVARWSKKGIIFSYKGKLELVAGKKKEKDEVKRTVVQENIQYSKFLLV